MCKKFKKGFEHNHDLSVHSETKENVLRPQQRKKKEVLA
jgi:hypothetical protein